MLVFIILQNLNLRVHLCMKKLKRQIVLLSKLDQTVSLLGELNHPNFDCT
jgi:hypothetical protein